MQIDRLLWQIMMMNRLIPQVAIILFDSMNGPKMSSFSHFLSKISFFKSLTIVHPHRCRRSRSLFLFDHDQDKIKRKEDLQIVCSANNNGMFDYYSIGKRIRNKRLLLWSSTRIECSIYQKPIKHSWHCQIFDYILIFKVCNWTIRLRYDKVTRKTVQTTVFDSLLITFFEDESCCRLTLLRESDKVELIYLCDYLSQ